MLWPAPRDTKGLNGSVGAHDELVDADGLTKLDGYDVGVFDAGGIETDSLRCCKAT